MPESVFQKLEDFKQLFKWNHVSALQGQFIFQLFREWSVFLWKFHKYSVLETIDTFHQNIFKAVCSILYCSMAMCSLIHSWIFARGLNNKDFSFVRQMLQTKVKFHYFHSPSQIVYYHYFPDCKISNIFAMVMSNRCQQI